MEKPLTDPRGGRRRRPRLWHWRNFVRVGLQIRGPGPTSFPSSDKENSDEFPKLNYYPVWRRYLEENDLVARYRFSISDQARQGAPNPNLRESVRASLFSKSLSIDSLPPLSPDEKRLLTLVEMLLIVDDTLIAQGDGVSAMAAKEEAARIAAHEMALREL